MSRRLNVAVLINHSTAGVFYANLFQALGHTVYLPLRCTIEKMALTENNVLQVRTVDPALEYVPVLDRYDFYKNQPDGPETERVYALLLRHFDLVLTYHVIAPALNRKLFRQTTKNVMLILWGDPRGAMPSNIAACYPELVRNPRVTLVAAHAFVTQKLGTAKYLPLGLPKMMGAYENTYKGHTSVVLIVQSRFNDPYWEATRQFVHRVAQAAPQVSFVLVGKQNEHYRPPVKNLTTKTFATTAALYAFMATCKLFVALNPGSMILQYAPIEAAALGLPILYDAPNVRICSEIGQNPLFMFGAEASCAAKIKELLARPAAELAEQCAYQRALYASRKFEHVSTLWDAALEQMFPAESTPQHEPNSTHALAT